MDDGGGGVPPSVFMGRCAKYFPPPKQVNCRPAAPAEAVRFEQ